MMQTRFHRARRYREHFRYFFDAQVFAVKEVNDLALSGVELRDRRGEIDGVARRAPTSIVFRTCFRLLLLGRGQPAPTLIESDGIDAFPVGDAVDPGREPGGIRQLLQPSNRPDPGLLDDVVGEGAMPNRARRVANEPGSPAA